MNETDPPFGQPDVVPLSDEDAAVQVVEAAVLGLWEVVNQLTRLRRTMGGPWRSVNGAAFRRGLGRAVAAL